MEVSGDDQTHIIKAPFLSLLWCAVKTTQAWRKQARGVHKSSTSSSEKVLQMSACLEPSDRGTGALKMAWWGQVAACKQQAKSKTTQLPEDEQAASGLFLRRSAHLKKARQARMARS